MKAVLNTGSTLRQGCVIKGGGKMTDEYMREAAVCYMNPEDFRMLWLEWGSFLDKVKIISGVGEITLHVKSSGEVKQGQVFIPRGPWANYVIDAYTFDSGSPYYKGMTVDVVPADDEVLDCCELMKQYTSKE